MPIPGWGYFFCLNVLSFNTSKVTLRYMTQLSIHLHETGVTLLPDHLVLHLPLSLFCNPLWNKPVLSLMLWDFWALQMPFVVWHPKWRLHLFAAAFDEIQQLVKSSVWTLMNIGLGVQTSTLLRHSVGFVHSWLHWFSLYSAKPLRNSGHVQKMSACLIWIDTWLQLRSNHFLSGAVKLHVDSYHALRHLSHERLSHQLCLLLPCTHNIGYDFLVLLGHWRDPKHEVLVPIQALVGDKGGNFSWNPHLRSSLLKTIDPLRL